MSKRIGNISIIEDEPDKICGVCGKLTDTRPYGPKGMQICVPCGDKIPDVIKHNMGILLFGKSGELR